MTISGASVLRLVGLGLLAWLMQLTVVSQLTVFGVPADLTPLVVAFVGYIAGSTTGAIFGFALGLFVDLTPEHTLGVNSLVFTAVGYLAGRIRELRDPAHGLAPVAVGAAFCGSVFARFRSRWNTWTTLASSDTSVSFARLPGRSTS